MRYEYWAELTPDPDGGYLVTFPDVPEALTHGDTKEEALENAREALGLALRGYVAGKQELPASKLRRKLYPVVPSADDAIKLATVLAFRESGKTKVELAALLGKGENEIRRILDPDHPTKLASMQAALRLLGKEIVIDIRDAA